MTRHLDCPSAPLGEVVDVRLDLVLGEDVGLDLVLGDPLGLVLGDLLEEGFLGGGVSRGRGQTGLKSCSCHNSVMAADLMLINITLCCCCFVFKFNLFCGKGDTAPNRLDSRFLERILNWFLMDLLVDLLLGVHLGLGEAVDLLLGECVGDGFRDPDLCSSVVSLASPNAMLIS